MHREVRALQQVHKVPGLLFSPAVCTVILSSGQNRSPPDSGLSPDSTTYELLGFGQPPHLPETPFPSLLNGGVKIVLTTNDW